MFFSLGCIIRLREHHAQTVVRFRILGSDLQRALQDLTCLIPTLLRTICIAQIVEREQMMRIQPQRLKKARHRIADASLARSNDAKIIPGIRQSIGIIGRQFHGAFESLARGGVFVLIQVNAANAVHRFRTRWIITQGLLERAFGLVEISALKKQSAVREVVSAEFQRMGLGCEWQSPRQSLGISSRNVLEVVFHVLGDDWAPIYLDDVALAVNQERCRKAEVAMTVE